METSRGVSIVIPTWNGLELLKRFLPSVIKAADHYSRLADAPVEIIAVDDGSVDDSVRWLEQQGFQVSDAGARTKLILNGRNLGFGEACNRGFKAARLPLVFLLNNDVEVGLDAIAPLVENFTDAGVFAAHPRVFDVESGRECGTGKVGGFRRGFIRVHQSYAPSAGAGGGRLYSIFASGGSAMFDRNRFLAIGGFESLLLPIYWEDVDISYRAWKRGLSIVYEPRSVVDHRVSSTMRKVNQRKIRQLKHRNRLIYHWINLHDARMLASHVAWVALLALTAPLRFDIGFLFAFLEALKRLPQVRARRSEEKQMRKRSDREVFAIFEGLARRPDLNVYD
jgi:GT2 family glycosyltransferase